MKAVPFHVVYMGLDWYGFDVTLKDDTMTVDPGIVGREENPIRLDRNTMPFGGWSFEGESFKVQEADTHIEVVLYENEIYLLVRTNDPHEVFPHELDTLFSLAWKEGNEWVYQRPWRDRQYGKDSQRAKGASGHSGAITFL